MENEESILSKPLENNVEVNMKKYEVTKRKQFFGVFRTYLVMAVAMLVIVLVAFSTIVFGDSGLRGLVIALMIFVFFMTMYSTCYNVAQQDNKSYSKLKPYKYKGLVLALPIMILTIVFFVLYKIVWIKFGVDTVDHGTAASMLYTKNMNDFASWFDKGIPTRVLQGKGPIATNISFMVWTFPFYGIINPDKGSANTLGVVVATLLPGIACQIGYMLGCKNFDLSQKLRRFIYDK